MLGSQMRLPSTGPSLPLPSPRHFVGGGVAGGVAQGQDIESSIQNWRETFLNKYHEQAREDETDSIAETDSDRDRDRDVKSAMEGGNIEREGAINLTHSRPSSVSGVSNSQHNDMEHETSSIVSLIRRHNGDSLHKAHQPGLGQDREDCDSESGKMSPAPPLQLPLLPPGLQQMHQLLQNSPFSGLNPSQLQQLVQQSADAGRKQLEQLVPQLQEQLQVNFVQQTHLLQSDRAKASPALHQLQMQQQQLISQLQLVQQRLIMGGSSSGGLGSLLDGGKEHESKENNWRDREEKMENGDVTPDNNNTIDKNKNGNISPEPDQHTLYNNGLCKWTGCDTRCDDGTEFQKHIVAEHVLDDKSTAQARVQMQIVSQLELQLQKERERLQAMMTHLHLNKKKEEERKLSDPRENGFTNRTPEPDTNKHQQQQQQNLPKPLGFGPTPPLPNLGFPPNIGGISGFPGPRPPGFGFLPPGGANPSLQGPIRRRITDKTPMSLPSGFPYMFDRTGLDIAQELHRNREFYRTHDVRPPFTYASLIRQAIMEVPDKQLTLHGIYDWFTSTFAYFRRNLKSWKNAIRTNLSLHKCFVRYEDDFGSFWMVDDAEFIKRRHLSRGRPRKYEPGPLGTQPATQPRHSGASQEALEKDDKINSENVQTKSPTLSHNLNPGPFGDNLNSSLKNALGLLNQGMSLNEKMMPSHQNNNLPDLRPPSGNFDSVLRNRYFPGGPTPDGLDSDIMFKNSMADSDHFHADLRERSRRESEEMMTDNRYRMTPPESPRDRDGASVASVDMSADISGSDQKHREQGSKLSAQDLSLMQRNIKNENNDTEH